MMMNHVWFSLFLQYNREKPLLCGMAWHGMAWHEDKQNQKIKRKIYKNENTERQMHA